MLSTSIRTLTTFCSFLMVGRLALIDRVDHQDAIYAVKEITAAVLDVHVQSCDGSPMNATLVDLVDADSGARYTEETDDDGNVEFTVARNRNYTVTTQTVAGMDTPPELKTFVGDVAEASVVVDLNYVQELNRITSWILKAISLMPCSPLKMTKSNG